MSKIKVTSVTYGDGHKREFDPRTKTNGKVVLKSRHVNPEQSSARIQMGADYESKVNQIISDIQRSSKSDGDRILALYKYFVNNIEYWDDYPKGAKAIAGEGPFTYTRENGEKIEIKLPGYNSKECAILAGYSVCGGISNAFKDILGRMGIESYIVYNGTHQWNMIKTCRGDRYIDLSQAVQRFSRVDNIKSSTKMRPKDTNERLFVDNFMATCLKDSYYGHAGGRILAENRENNGREEI